VLQTEEADREQKDAPYHSQEPERLHRQETAEKPLILDLQDDQTVRELIRRHLEREGFAIVSASGGNEGLRLARELNPAAITLDVKMPDLDGWTVLAAIKGDPKLAHIPVVLMTIIDEKNRGFSLGATEYLVKPVESDALVRVLREVSNAPAGRILIVDDDEVDRSNIRSALERVGWQITEADNGQVALKRLRDARPDVIVLDLMMPQMDGFEFLDQIRCTSEWREIPVIIITARDLTADDSARLNGWVERVIQKKGRDEMLREVLDVLSRCVERRRGERVAVA
jgi:CheY-like chemotaxis protein